MTARTSLLEQEEERDRDSDLMEVTLASFLHLPPSLVFMKPMSFSSSAAQQERERMLSSYPQLAAS